MEEPAKPNPMPRAYAWGILLLILGFAAVLRTWHIADHSFWLDEFLTVELSSGHGLAHLDLQRGELTTPVPDFISLPAAQPLYKIWTNSKRDVHPPLFYVILRLWREVFGEGDPTIRGLSATLSILAIIALFIAVNAQAGAAPALWASLLMAVSAAQIEYAQETRSYMLLEVCLLGAAAALLCIEHRGPAVIRLVMLGSLSLGAILSHYLALPLLGVIGLYALIRLRGATLRKVLLTLALSAVVFGIVWGPFAWAQTEGMFQRTSFVKADHWSIPGWLFNLAVLPLRYFVSAPTRSHAIGALGAALFVLPVLLLRQQRSLLIWWLWLCVGIGSLAISDLRRHGEMLAYLRYSVAVSPAAFALVALMLSHMQGWFRHIVPMMLSLACIGALEGAYARYKADWRVLGHYLDARLGRDGVLVVYDDRPDPWEVRCALVGIQYYMRPGPPKVAYLERPPRQDMKQAIEQSPIILVFTPSLGTGAKILFPESRISEGRIFESIGTVVRVELDPSPATAPGAAAAIGPEQKDPS